jgi:low affinity Fe/Cu permease
MERTTGSPNLRNKSSSFARRITTAAGSVAVWSVVAAGLVGWLVIGFVWGFSDQWHKWLHSVASGLTLMMLFLLQHTENRESRAALIKLDELLRTSSEARNDMMAVESADPRTQEQIEDEMAAHPDSASGETK